MEKQEQPLVSVPVITYNSSKTILETLESIKAQTYPNIELIISDDCSQDNTVELCHEWIEQNKERFVKAELLTIEKNTGVPANLNRGVINSHGVWIKYIAGDDILAANCIHDFVDFVQEKGCQMCVCNLDLFSTEGEVDVRYIQDYQNFFDKASENFESQKERILKELFFCGPGYFFSKALYDEVGGFDENYLGEEWPFCIKVLYSNHQIFTINKKLVRYRVSPNSLSQRVVNPKTVPRFFYYVRRNFYEYRLPQLLKRGMYLDAWYMLLDYEKQNALYTYEYNNKHILYIIIKILLSAIDYRFYKRQLSSKKMSK